MEFCRECGHKLEENSLFCGECGTSKSGESPRQSVPSTNPVTVPRQPMSKKTKLLLIIGAATIVLLFGIHNLLNFMFSEDRLIDKLEEALLEKDEKGLASLLTSDDKKLEINEKSVKSLMTFFEENPDQIKVVVADLKYQAEAFNDEEKMDDLLDGYFRSNIINLTKEGKFLFYDKYEIAVPGVYLSINTNYQDTVLYVDGEEVGKSDTTDYMATFGPFLPGYHSAKAVLTTDYMELEEEVELFFSGDYTKEETGIYLYGENVTFYLDNREDGSTSSHLFINGKDMNHDLMENPAFGPVLTDGTLNFSIETRLPWGTVKTEELPIDKDSIEVGYLNDDLKNTLMETAHNYHLEQIDAFATGDTSKMTTASPDLKEDIASESLRYKEMYAGYQAEYLSTAFDLNSFSLDYDGEHWVASLEGRSIVNEDLYYKDEELGDFQENTTNYTYILFFDTQSNKWLIDYLTGVWYFDDENLKEYLVENPTLLTAVWMEEESDEEENEEEDADV